MIQSKILVLRRMALLLLAIGMFTQPAFAQQQGHWLFVADGTGVELRPCAAGEVSLCGVITRLPKSAAALSSADRKAVCGIRLLNDLKPAKAKDGELARLDGSVLDIDSMANGGKPSSYAASFVVLSENHGRLDVKGTFGIVIERHKLMRALVAPSVCE